MAQFSGILGNVGGRMSAAVHKIRGRGFHLAEKKSLSLSDRTSGVDLTPAGCEEAVFSAIRTKVPELSRG